MVRPTLVLPSLLLASALLGAACTGPLSVENRSCPCSAGVECCGSTQMCLAPGEACEDLSVQVLSPTIRRADGVQVQQGALAMARQGDMLKLRVRGLDLVDVTEVKLGEIAVRGA